MWQPIANFILAHPELIAIGAALIFAGAFSEGLRIIWLQTLTAMEVTRVMATLDAVVSYGFCSTLWRYLDPTESHGLVVITSLGIALSAPLAHLMGRMAIIRRWPWLEPPK